jgi:phosphosulfolactate synthase (CoM biosynthesis protein A)
LAEQNKTVGQGYANAYDKAMQQFNTEQGRQMEADKASEASRQYGSDFGLKSLNELQEAGKAQRDIEAEGIAADKAQFEEARDWDKKMAQYKQGLFSGLPVSTQVNTTNTNPITDWLQSGSTLSKLLESFNKP